MLLGTGATSAREKGCNFILDLASLGCLNAQLWRHAVCMGISVGKNGCRQREDKVGLVIGRIFV